jgi:hypothetical protein
MRKLQNVYHKYEYMPLSESTDTELTKRLLYTAYHCVSKV